MSMRAELKYRARDWRMVASDLLIMRDCRDLYRVSRALFWEIRISLTMLLSRRARQMKRILPNYSDAEIVAGMKLAKGVRRVFGKQSSTWAYWRLRFNLFCNRGLIRWAYRL